MGVCPGNDCLVVGALPGFVLVTSVLQLGGYLGVIVSDS